jgi:hypothetical protein
VIDTSGAYIPGHGTPTVILLGRHRKPVDEVVRTVMGIKGEPSTPEDPAKGLVWSAIVSQIDQAGSESNFVSVANTLRATFAKHPWSIGGGGAAELREQIEGCPTVLGQSGSDLGFLVITGEDNCLMLPREAACRIGFRSTIAIGEGDAIRDWNLESGLHVLWPYDRSGRDLEAEYLGSHINGLWAYRTSLKARKAFGVPVEQKGLRWWDLREVYRARLGKPLFIAYAFVATHNHFILHRGASVFKQSAPVIQLADGATEADYTGLTGLLNSSVACFWMKQVFHNKGSTVDQHGARQRTDAFEDFYEHTSTGLKDFPLPTLYPVAISKEIEILASRLNELQPCALLATGAIPTRLVLDTARERFFHARRLMIALQEELDWRCYKNYSLLPADAAEEVELSAIPEVSLGERAFEIVLARRVAEGREQTTWFERHGSTPVTEIPSHWPEGYRRVVFRRIELIEQDKSIGLIERPEFKRRWNSPKWEDLEQAALRDRLLARLEASALWPASADQPPQLTSTSRLADTVQRDAEFMQIAALYAGHTDFDLPQLLAELVAAEAVPALPVQRYADTGLRKLAQWQDTWAMQRREDAIDADVDALAQVRREELMQTVIEVANGAAPDAEALKWVEETLAKEFTSLRKDRKANEIGPIPVPPKYQSKDFLKADFWRLRGGLDVPKERWISYPGCERGADGSLVIAWAGWNHLQQATALAGYYMDMKESEGWEAARLQPLLVALLELVPWLEQWHNDVDPVFGERMGHYYRGFVTEEARALGFTLDDLRAWKPAATAAKRGRKKKDAT